MSYTAFASASTFPCYGAFWDGRWIMGTFEADLLRMHINILEAYVVTRATLRWGHFWAGQFVTFQIDNRTVVFAFDRRRPRNPVITTLVKAAVRHAILHNFDFDAEHIAGVDNTIPDALSRNDMARFWAAAEDWSRATGRPVHPEAD